MENYMEENYMKGYLTRQEIINLIKEQLNYELNLAQIKIKLHNLIFMKNKIIFPQILFL